MEKRVEKWREVMCGKKYGDFHELKKAEIGADSLQNILVDIDRSIFNENLFPNERVRVKGPENVEKKKKELKEVLVAFAKKNSTIEYCQGLSYYASFLLQIYSPEETFVIMCHTIEKNRLEKLFDKRLSLVSKVLSVHGRVLNLTLPESIRKSVQRIGNNTHDYAAGWYLTLFSRLPPSLYVEVLDLFFAHGFPVLFHAASALVEIGHYMHILDKQMEIDQQTQILFKLAEHSVPEKEFQEILNRNMQMVSVSTIEHMLQEDNTL